MNKLVDISELSFFSVRTYILSLFPIRIKLTITDCMVEFFSIIHNFDRSAFYWRQKWKKIFWQFLREFGCKLKKLNIIQIDRNLLFKHPKHYLHEFSSAVYMKIFVSYDGDQNNMAKYQLQSKMQFLTD